MPQKIDLTVTGYIFRKDTLQLLLIHHKKLDKWLPVGGHLEPNEVPDDGLLREIQEETGLPVKLLQYAEISNEGNVERNCAIPFHSNIHSVGDHLHHSFFYLCEAESPELLKTNKELKAARWYSETDLVKPEVPIDIRNISIEAFRIYKERYYKAIS